MTAVHPQLAGSKSSRSTCSVSPGSAPFSYAPLIVAIWVVAGVVLYFLLRMRNPQATNEIGAAVAEA